MPSTVFDIPELCEHVLAFCADSPDTVAKASRVNSRFQDAAERVLYRNINAANLNREALRLVDSSGCKRRLYVRELKLWRQSNYDTWGWGIRCHPPIETRIISWSSATIINLSVNWRSTPFPRSPEAITTPAAMLRDAVTSCTRLERLTVAGIFAIVVGMLSTDSN